MTRAIRGPSSARVRDRRSAEVRVRLLPQSACPKAVEHVAHEVHEGEWVKALVTELLVACSFKDLLRALRVSPLSVRLLTLAGRLFRSFVSFVNCSFARIRS